MTKVPFPAFSPNGLDALRPEVDGLGGTQVSSPIYARLAVLAEYKRERKIASRTYADVLVDTCLATACIMRDETLQGDIFVSVDAWNSKGKFLASLRIVSGADASVISKFLITIERISIVSSPSPLHRLTLNYYPIDALVIPVLNSM